MFRAYAYARTLIATSGKVCFISCDGGNLRLLTCRSLCHFVDQTPYALLKLAVLDRVNESVDTLDGNCLKCVRNESKFCGWKRWYNCWLPPARRWGGKTNRWSRRSEWRNRRMTRSEPGSHRPQIQNISSAMWWLRSVRPRLRPNWHWDSPKKRMSLGCNNISDRNTVVSSWVIG